MLFTIAPSVNSGRRRRGSQRSRVTERLLEAAPFSCLRALVCVITPRVHSALEDHLTLRSIANFSASGGSLRFRTLHDDQRHRSLTVCLSFNLLIVGVGQVYVTARLTPKSGKP